MKNVQIPYDLFLALVRYHLAGDNEQEQCIQEGLSKKLDSLVLRELYTQSKIAPTHSEREAARQEYLDRQGIPTSFRWDSP